VGLSVYKKKRSFKVTPEPKGKIIRNNTHLFIIQKHDASHLHYDFRLAINGVLKSWAVPKGPCLDPSVKRLAVEVEDHPLDYANFEGVIPQEKYGGGTVMVWDRGTWESEENLARAYKKGIMLFTLQGKKLQGAWHLIRTNRQSDKPQWLLFKGKDKFSKDLSNYDITLKKPSSVLTGKSLQEIENSTINLSKKFSAKLATFSNNKNSLSKFLTHPDKLLYIHKKITKLDLASYYYTVAEKLLPFIKNRPVTLVRCPAPGTTKCFYQKNWLQGMSKDITTTVKTSKGSSQYIMINNKSSLIAAAQLDILEIHPWLSKKDKLNYPDMLIFDLDPSPEIPWTKLVSAAFLIKNFFTSLHLKSFIKSTGKKGLHIVIPITRKNDFKLIKHYTKKIAGKLSVQFPDLFTFNLKKEKRKGRIFIDYLRNGYGATAIAPFSPRSNINATIAVPISWEKLKKSKKTILYTVKTINKYLKDYPNDPWEEFLKIRQSVNNKLLDNL